MSGTGFAVSCGCLSQFAGAGTCHRGSAAFLSAPGLRLSAISASKGIQIASNGGWLGDVPLMRFDAFPDKLHDDFR